MSTPFPASLLGALTPTSPPSLPSLTSLSSQTRVIQLQLISIQSLKLKPNNFGNLVFWSQTNVMKIEKKKQQHSMGHLITLVSSLAAILTPCEMKKGNLTENEVGIPGGGAHTGTTRSGHFSHRNFISCL